MHRLFGKPQAWAALLCLLMLVFWEASARWLGLSALVLPAPSAVWRALWQGLSSGFFWPHLLQTTLELLSGLMFGCVLGFFGGLLLGEWTLLRRVLMPYVVISQVLPKLALVPLFLMWFGFGATPTVVITALICFFPLLEYTMTGLVHVDPQRLELFRMLGASRSQTLWHMKVPACLPGIWAGLRVAVVLALVGTVVGEFMSASKGLGALIIATQGSMDTPLMFAVLLLIALMGLFFYQITLALERRALRRYIRS